MTEQSHALSFLKASFENAEARRVCDLLGVVSFVLGVTKAGDDALWIRQQTGRKSPDVVHTIAICSDRQAPVPCYRLTRTVAGSGDVEEEGPIHGHEAARVALEDALTSAQFKFSHFDMP